jgi:accessory gene regulator B
MIIGLLLNIVVESAVFFGSFLFIRRYAGGYHAKKEWMCLILSTLGVSLSLVLVYYIKLFLWLKTVFFILSLLSGIVICLISPLEAKNKPLSQDEKKKYSFFSIIRVFLAIITIILFALFKFYFISVPVTTAVLYEGVLIIGGYMNMPRCNFK